MIVPEIRMVRLDSVVQDGDDDPLARVSPGPGGRHVHVEASSRPAVEVPLLQEHRVIGKPICDLPFGGRVVRARLIVREKVFERFGPVSFHSFLFDLLFEPLKN